MSSTWVQEQNGYQLNNSWISTTGMTHWSHQLHITYNKSKNGLLRRKRLEFVETKTIPGAGVIKEEQEVNLSNSTDAIITNPVAVMSNLPTRSEVKRFACSQCGKAFLGKNDLTRHLRVHSGEKPFACSQCGKAFAQKHTLTEHLRVHSGEKTFGCEKCGKLFTHLRSRNRHVKGCKKWFYMMNDILSTMHKFDCTLKSTRLPIYVLSYDLRCHVF